MGNKVTSCFSVKRNISTQDIPCIDSVSVLVYDKTRVGSKVKAAVDERCEAVCTQIGKSMNMTRVMLHCFSLAIYNQSDDSFTWLSATDELPANVEVHFRMRFIPHMKKFTEIMRLYPDCFKYLFWQVSWDFLHDKQHGFTTHKAARGASVHIMLTTLRSETELQGSTSENVKSFLEQNDCTLFLPPSLRKYKLDKIILKKSMTENLKELQKTKVSSLTLMKVFLDHILRENQSYYIEQYTAFQITHDMVSTPASRDGEMEPKITCQQVNIAIEMGCQHPKLKVTTVTVQNDPTVSVLISDVDRLFSLEIRKTAIGETTWWTTQIDRQDGHPEILYFTSQQKAYSFVSCLESYFRLTCGFYSSLCTGLEPVCVRELRNISAYGPVTNEYVSKQLKKRNCKDVYILRGSIKAHDEYEVLYQPDPNKSIKIWPLGKVTKSSKGYTLEGSGLEPTPSMRTLLHEAIKRQNWVPENCVRIKPPQSEGCDILQNILLDQKVADILEEEDENTREQQQRQPKVYTSDSVNIQSLIDHGFFTETHTAMLDSQELVVVKHLRKDIPDEYYKHVHEAFQEGFDKLVRLNDKKYFVGFMGFTLTSSPGMLMRHASHGSLRHFLQTKDHTRDVLTLRHLVDVTIQLASALLYMDDNTYCHGNLHCDNILVFNYNHSEISVRIGDPGLVSLYNGLPLDTKCNRKRLPWLAPELYEDLSKISHLTDMFAFGTTLWQMFSEGRSPLEAATELQGKSAAQVCDFFKSSALSCPIYLKEKPEDPDLIRKIKRKLYDIMKSLWVVDSQNRVDAKTLLREVNSFVQTYGDSYHTYNIIPEEMSTLLSTLYPQSSGENSGSLSGSIIHTSGVFMSENTHVNVPIDDLLCLGSRREQKATLSSRSEEPKQITLSDKEENMSPKHAQNHQDEQTLATGTTPLQDSHTESRTAGTSPRTQDASMPVSQVDGTTPRIEGTISPQAAVATLSAVSRPMGTRGLPPVPVVNGNPPRRTAIVSDIRYLIQESRLNIDQTCILGSGHYGDIKKATLAPNSSSGFRIPIVVAVKALKRDMVDRFREEFIKEAQIMETLEHPNIVKFYGICKQGEMVVMEFVANNSLVKYLLKNESHIDKVQMVKFAVDISAGMDYLSSKNVIHCDLAARNVLLDEDLLAKISDFGLSKILCQDKDYYRRQKERTIPILWCSPEWMGHEKKFTTKSDVWSFGVVLWEIYSYGKPPLFCKDLKDFLKRGFWRLSEGHRLLQPEACDDEMYALMKNCWEWEPEKRPEFSQCHTRLTEIWKKNGGGQDSNPDDYSRTNAQNELVEIPASVNLNGPATNQTRDTVIGQSVTPNIPVLTNGVSASACLFGESPKSASQSQSSAPPLSQLANCVPGDARSQVQGTKNHAAGSGHQSIFLDLLVIRDEKHKLGKGSFGEVFRARYHDKDVAVKRCTVEEEKARFRRELQILHQCQHPNIVQFLGIHKSKEDMEYVMEFMAGGNLASYLVERKKNQATNLITAADILDRNLKILCDIAKGLDYLFSKNIVHCDLTAVNILLTADLQAKICDFGWAKILENGEGNLSYRRNKATAQFKVRWAPPEVFGEAEYNKYSDIWSYGVVCMEVFLDGAQPELSPPLPACSRDQFPIDFCTRINKGERYKCPPECPDEIYRTMLECWKTEPSERILFGDLVKFFTRYLEKTNIAESS